MNVPREEAVEQPQLKLKGDLADRAGGLGINAVAVARDTGA
jgi:hypothetical protein